MLALIFFTLNADAEETTVAPQAPAWQLKTQSGDTISSAQFDGQATILHFWATWCPYCKVLQPKLVELEKKYQQQGVKLVAISFNEDDGVLPQDELAARGYSFPTAVHGDEVASLYGVNGTPTTFFINKHKQVIFKYTSADTSDPRLELAVQAIVK
ncbi:TlpA family protein disulfide reductase [Colwellia sp. MB02u-18]|nr:TlpA family protein disulfide reductase [Colwellia sp. MB3u-45]MBA6265930.1 TlpA family protein disulfide reductase [Colwellia sp. MB3u-43]MBA6322656.1 TlpA family protein disulfide reductase [Colwellia sp. MB02u-19]MBA6323593.1 TlpA family protein disulfide reductase [Colwellia sp. MB02u-18]MBA6332799.1 TlpA family protein disulfide reductase [Colwellia sp. MB02u-12]MBA6343696.1 TlpA family protein disulfide reductase [Colwellia sp. MB02u-1]